MGRKRIVGRWTSEPFKGKDKSEREPFLPTFS
jgi:hypothetical protein